jgi:hypothetical protein
MATLLKIVGLSDGSAFDRDVWLAAYDVDANPKVNRSILLKDGAIIHGPYGGRIEVTTIRDQAMTFADAGQAMAAWNSQSTRLPLRPDGRPNKPLTALTVELETQ